uniref:Huntingtin-like n=1 Tax=Hirondellea gigas TaxID=1518452 RepID=A0A2P2I646_9CRUS
MEISECLVSVRAEYPSLCLLCARLHTMLDLPALHLWPHLLRSVQRKTPVTTPNTNNGVLASPAHLGPSSCLSLQYLRQSSVLLFAQYVTEHLCEEEWLAWVLVQHTGDVVQLQQQRAVQRLLHAVHASTAASALLLHALNTRACTQLQKSEYGEALLATVSNVHASQSGTLVRFLLLEMFTQPHFLHVTAAVALVLRHRLQLLLSPPAAQTLQQLTQQQLQPYTRGGQHYAAVRRRCSEVSGLLEQLQQRVGRGGDVAVAPPLEPVLISTPTLDLAWYLRLVTSRCSRDGGGSAEECCQLLLHLDQTDLLTVMKSELFNLQLLQHTLHYGLQATLRNAGSIGRTESPANNSSRNSSPNSNRSNSSNTSSVSSGSTTSSTSGGEHPLYSTSKLLLLHHISNMVATLPKPHYDYRPAGGNKYSERMNQVLSDGCVGGQLEQLAQACSLYFNTLPRLPWRAHVQTAHAHTLLRFALLAAEFLQYSVERGTGSIWLVSVCLGCVDAALASLTLSQRLATPDYTAYVCSMIAALHLTVSYVTAPAPLPQLVEALAEGTSNGGSVGVAADRLMQLVLWLEQNGHESLPPHVAAPIRGLVMALGRCPCVNAMARCPPELWTAGWNPSLSSPSQLPPLPAHLLLEPDILKQFIFRVQLFGWLNRQQFEETWMALLTVLNTDSPHDSSSAQEQPYRDQSVCVCVRGLSGLLRQSLLLPTPGNPHTALRRTVAPPTASKQGPLKSVVQGLRDRASLAQHLTGAAPSTTLVTPLSLQHLPVHTIAAALICNNQQDEYDGSSSPYERAEHSSQLAAMGIDLNSCTHFLHDLFAAWLTPGRLMCSSVMCEVAKCLCVMVDILTSEEQQVWVAEACVTLHSTHPTEDHTTHQYLILAAAKALAVCRAAQLSVGLATSEGVLHMVDSGLKSANVGVRSCSLHAVLFLLQQPPHLNVAIVATPPSAAAAATNTTAFTPDKSSPLRLLQGTQLSRTALSALTSHIKPPAATPDTTAQDTQDPFLASVLQITVPYVLKACDTRVSEGEAHSTAAWEVCLYLVEYYSSVTDASLPSTALQLALTAAASSNTTPTLLLQVLGGVERMLRVQLPELQSSATGEVVLKLVMDLVQHGPPAVALPALPLLLTLLYTANRRGQSSSSDTDPELLLQLMEKLGIVFERIKTGYSYEAWLLAGLLSTCLLDLLPANQVLNKVIMEYISSQQPYPHLLAATLFQVFEGCIEESGEGLVQEWVLMSLGNFTRREPVSLAVWCITCFLVAASRNPHLRAAYASVLTWPAQLSQHQQYSTPRLSHDQQQQQYISTRVTHEQQLQPQQLELFCLAATQFAAALPSESHRDKFREVFADVATPGSPFFHMLSFLDTSKRLT